MSTEEKPVSLEEAESQQRIAKRGALADQLMARARERLLASANSVNRVYRPGITISSLTEDEAAITDSEIAAAMRQLNLLSDITVFYEFATEYFGLPVEVANRALEAALTAAFVPMASPNRAAPLASATGTQPAPGVMVATRKHERNLSEG